MHPLKKRWFFINAVGGLAVLGSYVHGLATHPDQRDALWGSIPAELQSVYTVTMLLAAAGYFFFSYEFVFKHDTASIRIGSFGFSALNVLYAIVLVCSALWLPLTFAYINAPSPALWMAIRGVLFGTGLGAVGLLIALFTMTPRPTGLGGVLTLIGLLFFCLQTAFLDAFVWPALF